MSSVEARGREGGRAAHSQELKSAFVEAKSGCIMGRQSGIRKMLDAGDDKKWRLADFQEKGASKILESCGAPVHRHIDNRRVHPAGSFGIALLTTVTVVIKYSNSCFHR
jgi:hypothetical protein